VLGTGVFGDAAAADADAEVLLAEADAGAGVAGGAAEATDAELAATAGAAVPAGAGTHDSLRALKSCCAKASAWLPCKGAIPPVTQSGLLQPPAR